MCSVYRNVNRSGDSVNGMATTNLGYIGVPPLTDIPRFWFLRERKLKFQFLIIDNKSNFVAASQSKPHKRIYATNKATGHIDASKQQPKKRRSRSVEQQPRTSAACAKEDQTVRPQ